MPQFLSAQKNTFENKEPERDTMLVYKKIKKMAYKHKITQRAYELVFVDPEPKEYPVQPATKEVKNVNPYLKYEGKIIKDIQITIYDPFGHNVNDTNMSNINRMQKLGNSAHITTRRFVIINKLLFKVNDTINPLSLSETERILREAIFINDARIYITKSKHRDSVTVNVVVQDKWPITVPILVTDIFVNARFRNFNLFGAGQQFEQFGKITKPGIYEFNGYYGIANIDNTYISSRLGYSTDINETKIYLGFDRPFFSPLTTWAGGIAFNHSWKKYIYTDTVIGETKKIPLNNFGYDVWAGKSFKFKKLSKDKSIFNQSTSFILGTRYYTATYLNRPSHSIDTSRSYYNAKAALGNIGFAVQQYYKDKYIYRFGANEDVPEGLIVQFTYGGLKYEFKKIRYYIGIEVAKAKHFKKLGYVSTTFSYGIFFNEKVANDVTTNYKLYYFSNLLKNGQWFFRQFLTYNYVHGENKLANETINFGDELYGFENRTLSGNTKMTLNSETVAYLPYNLIGFRLAPVINIGVGMIGSKTSQLQNSNLYQAYTIGVMVRNENLLSSTFQFAVGAYPFFPDDGKFTLKYNPVTSFTLRVRAFSVSKPEFISY
ncbi:MAG: hypothetical protein H7141_08630 [Burkholderiales bacterium]|nr:hypothetical protein [Bacteroidia bacterium]